MAKFVDIPVRENGTWVTYAWFNALRLAGITVENAAQATLPAIRFIDLNSGTPPEIIEYNCYVRRFVRGDSQILPFSFVVPESYVSGDQILFKGKMFSGVGGGTGLLQADVTLIRNSTDPVDDTTNQHTSTNSAISLPTAKVNELFLIDLTDTNGQINGVAVSAGDLLKVQLSRGTDTDTGDLRLIPPSVYVTFS